MDDRFFRAFFAPAEATICGYRLKPFCAGHVLVLTALGSPLVRGEDEPFRPCDLLIALRVCEHGWPFQPEMRPRLRDVWRRWRLERDQERFVAAARAFLRWQGEHSSLPQFWKDATPGKKPGKPITAPSMLTLVVSLVSRGIPERDAWEMSLGRAMWLSAAMAEREGAEVKFAYEHELRVPMFEMSEDEIVERARQDLSPEDFRTWITARRSAGITGLS